MKLLCTLHPTPVSPINDKNIPIQDGRLIVKEIDKHEDKDQRLEIALQKKMELGSCVTKVPWNIQFSN